MKIFTTKRKKVQSYMKSTHFKNKLKILSKNKNIYFKICIKKLEKKSIFWNNKKKKSNYI